MSEENVEALQQGRGLGYAPSWWHTSIVRDEAEDDAVWVELEIPESEVAEYEVPGPHNGYREFELTDAVIVGWPVKRAPL